MHQTIETRPEGQRPVFLHVNGEDWAFSLSGVRRVGRDLFVQVTVQGPEVCGVTLHLRDRIVLGSTAEEILMATCEWLVERGSATHGFVDLCERQRGWMTSQVA